MVRAMKTIRCIVVTGILGALLAGCASNPPSGTRPARPADVERASEKQPYDFRSEGKIPPLQPGDAANEPDIQEIGVSENRIDVADADAPPVVAPTEPTPVETLADGFRVQVFATADRAIADSEAQLAGGRFGAPAYVDLDGGMYKVRVGDFVTRAEADKALAAIRRNYADAWVVATKIRVKRAP